MADYHAKHTEFTAIEAGKWTGSDIIHWTLQIWKFTLLNIFQSEFQSCSAHGKIQPLWPGKPDVFGGGRNLRRSSV